MSASPREITQLLLRWREGDGRALDQLMPHVYQELRRIARHYMATERRDHTLQSTALINEAYLRLIEYKEVEWNDRTHFFAVASQAMRRVLVDHARARLRSKRGGGAPKASLEQVAVAVDTPRLDLIALDRALTALAEIDPRKSRVVELRYFGGLTVEETAEVLEVAPLTVMRDWRAAKAWLLRTLTEGTPGAPSP